MRAGTLKHQIVIQSVTYSKSVSGEDVASWGTFATVWASIDPLQGWEVFKAGRMNAETTHRVTIRHRDGVLPTMRVIYGTQTFEILTVLPIRTAKREMQLMCKEVL